MNPSVRWIKLIDEVELRPGQSAEELALKFQVTERTIRRDLKKIEEFGFRPVSERGYRFLSKPFLRPLALSRSEQLAVMMCFELASKQVDAGTRDSLLSVLDKIRRDMGPRQRAEGSNLENVTRVQEDPETRSDIVNSDLNPLAQAIAHRQVTCFEYRGRDNSAFEWRKVEPINLYFKDKRWYLFAYDQNREDTRHFRLSRLKSLTITLDQFEKREDISADDQDFHEWDIRGNGPTEVSFRCSPSLARWFQENKPHPTVNVNPDHTVQVTIENVESFLRFFSSLDDALLINPPSAIRWFRDRLQEIDSLYD